MRFSRLCRYVVLLLVFFSQPLLAEISEQRQQQLLHHLRHDCGSCHGMTLKGGLGPSLLPSALKDKPSEILVATIMQGREGTAMPPWNALMTEEEATWLVEQLQKGVVPDAL